MPSNADIIRALREMALYLEMEEVPFKPRAYRNVAYAIAAMDRPLEEIYEAGGLKAIEEIEGVGKGIARRIAEMIDTGLMEDLETFREERPVDIFGLTDVEGIGPKMVKVLFDGLGITNVDQLAEAARSEMLRTLPRFGPKSEQRILRQLDFLHSTKGRLPLGQVQRATREIVAHLESMEEVLQICPAGSQRRFRDTIGDIDILVASRSPAPVMERFATMPGVEEVYAQGEKKTMVRLSLGIDADLLVVEPERFGAALLYFTGSKNHNIKLRMIAMKQGRKLSEYGVFEGEECLAAETEEDVYAALGLPYFPPEIREDRGEFEAADAGALPELLEPDDIKGDLQVQTSWSDGRASIEEMAIAARDRGFEYIVITDHTRDLYGLDEKRLVEQIVAIRSIDDELEGIRVLAGAEVNIRRDGTLDIADSVLRRLDFAGAAIHSSFEMPKEEQTARMIRAIEHPLVDVIFHPTCRKIAKRSPIQLDMEAVIKRAAETGTVLELDALPQRLDLSARYVRMAIEAGCTIAVDSDAHRPEHFDYVRELGVPTRAARLGGKEARPQRASRGPDAGSSETTKSMNACFSIFDMKMRSGVRRWRIAVASSEVL